MAKLSLDQIQAIITKPKNKRSIDLAIRQEQRLVVHCEPILEKGNLPNIAFRDFTTWYQSLVTKIKYPRISEMLGTPLSTISVTKDIFDQLGKFIDAQDRYIEYKFASVDYTNDYEDYLERSGDDNFWRIRCVEALKTEINSIIVVDLPKEQTTTRPEPYPYLVSIKNVVDIDISPVNGVIEYFIFKQPTRDITNADIGSAMFDLLANDGAKEIERIIAIDDQYYRVLERVKDKDKSSWVVVSQSEHALGYCPCIDFWSKAIKGTNGINKNGPITTVLHKLNYLLFYRALADYMSLYGPFPILVTYEEEDDEFDDKGRDINNGQIYSTEQFNVWDNAPVTQNPRKSQRDLIAPGGVMEVKAPDGKDDHDMMQNPMKYIGMDVESLKYVQDYIKRLENEIIEICTGEDKEYLNEIAKNPEMMSASYDAKDSILTDIKREFERTHRFVTKCRAELRYGKEYFLGCTIDYGSDYFLKDATTLTQEFGAAVKVGMPQGYSAEIAKAAINTRYKNNTEQLARMRILNDLEPYPNQDWETIQLLGINTSDELNFIIKANFIGFINKFELEVNASIVAFGSLIPYNKKINIIKQKLIEYARNTKWAIARPDSGNN